MITLNEKQYKAITEKLYIIYLKFSCEGKGRINREVNNSEKLMAFTGKTGAFGKR